MMEISKRSVNETFKSSNFKALNVVELPSAHSHADFEYDDDNHFNHKPCSDK